MGERGAGAALLGTEGGSAAILGTELSPGGKPETSAATARSQRGPGHQQGQGHRDQSPLCQAGVRAAPSLGITVTLRVCLDTPPCLGAFPCAGGRLAGRGGWQGDTAPASPSCGTSSCVCLRALALFQRLAEAAGAAPGQDSPAPGSTPRLCQQTPPAAEGNLQDAEDADTNCSSSLRMSYPKNSPATAPWCSQELAEHPWCPLHLQHKARLRGNTDT